MIIFNYYLVRIRLNQLYPLPTLVLTLVDFNQTKIQLDAIWPSFAITAEVVLSAVVRIKYEYTNFLFKGVCNAILYFIFSQSIYSIIYLVTVFQKLKNS